MMKKYFVSALLASVYLCNPVMNPAGNLAERRIEYQPIEIYSMFNVKTLKN